MTDLRKAAEMALDALERCEYGVISNARLKNSIEALRQALEESKQEPIKEPFNSKADVKEAFTLDREHEPFIYIREDTEMPFGGYEHCGEHEAGAFPVYTAPPKREWVGLTDEEFKRFSFNAPWEVVQEIEAKLKEKNSGTS